MSDQELGRLLLRRVWDRLCRLDYAAQHNANRLLVELRGREFLAEVYLAVEAGRVLLDVLGWRPHATGYYPDWYNYVLELADPGLEQQLLEAVRAHLCPVE